MLSTLPSRHRSPRPLSPAAGGPQRTLRNPIGCVGTGLHTGAKVALTLQPAAPDTGIRFLRYDRPGAVPIPASLDAVCDTTMAVTLGGDHRAGGGGGGGRVGSVEHLMAALAACEIDNALIEIGGPEVPVMDGSAQPFVFLIECAGRVEQDRPRRAIEILKPVGVAAAEGRSAARLEPAAGEDEDGGGGEAATLEIDLAIEIDHPLIRRQALRFAFAPDRFKADIAKARSFGFGEQVEDLWARGLALGGSLKNTVIVGRDRVLNEDGLRFEDEFVRHAVLDCVGDLYLAGAPLVGRYVGRCPGHGLHRQLLRALLADPTAWRFVNDDDHQGDGTMPAPQGATAPWPDAVVERRRALPA